MSARGYALHSVCPQPFFRFATQIFLLSLHHFLSTNHSLYNVYISYTRFVVFREVFLVSEETLVVPKLYITLPTCLLRVIDNDTGTEIDKVFQKVAPYVYKRNKVISELYCP